MIKVFHDKTSEAEGYPHLAMPLLEPLLAPQRMLSAAKQACPSWLPHYQLCDDPKLADVFVLVGDMEYYLRHGQMQVVANLVDLAVQFGKPVWIFSGSDFGITPTDNRLNVLRMGGHASQNNGNQFVMPPFINDPLQQADASHWKAIPWAPKPTVGFCGQADESLMRQIIDNVRNAQRRIEKMMGRNPYDLQPFISTTALRAKVLQQFESSDLMDAHFLKRKKYKAGANTAEEAAKVRKEYYENVYDNAYTVCLRGAGNYSIRFYDCLAAGRIPAYINTDCMLPLPGIIQWEKHIFSVEQSDLKHVEEAFVAFHHSLHNDKFSAIQQGNRTLWEKYLTYDGFFSHFHLLPPNKSFAALY